MNSSPISSANIAALKFCLDKTRAGSGHMSHQDMGKFVATSSDFKISTNEASVNKELFVKKLCRSISEDDCLESQKKAIQYLKSGLFVTTQICNNLLKEAINDKGGKGGVDTVILNLVDKNVLSKEALFALISDRLDSDTLNTLVNRAYHTNNFFYVNDIILTSIRDYHTDPETLITDDILEDVYGRQAYNPDRGQNGTFDWWWRRR